jgi:hypothetical protein
MPDTLPPWVVAPSGFAYRKFLNDQDCAVLVQSRLDDRSDADRAAWWFDTDSDLIPPVDRAFVAALWRGAP